MSREDSTVEGSLVWPLTKGGFVGGRRSLQGPGRGAKLKSAGAARSTV